MVLGFPGKKALLMGFELSLKILCSKSQYHNMSTGVKLEILDEVPSFDIDETVIYDNCVSVDVTQGRIHVLREQQHNRPRIDRCNSEYSKIHHIQEGKCFSPSIFLTLGWSLKTMMREFSFK